MNKERLFFALQVMVVALLISAFQVLFEYVEVTLGLTSVWVFAVNAPLAALILGLFYGLLLERPIEVTLRRYTIMTYVVVSALASIVMNAIDLYSLSQDIFSMDFFGAVIFSVLFYAVMYVVMTLCIDFVPRVLLRKKERSYVVDLEVPAVHPTTQEMPFEVYSTKKETVSRRSVAKKATSPAKKKPVTKKLAKKKTTIRKTAKKKSARSKRRR